VAGYIPRWFTCPQAVTHRSTNQARPGPAYSNFVDRIKCVTTTPRTIYYVLLVCSPHLTWRDLQHIVVLTARQANLDADDWAKNGVGRLGKCAVIVVVVDHPPSYSGQALRYSVTSLGRRQRSTGVRSVWCIGHSNR